ncbi:MAG: ARMT1-like domain-containing protein [Gammaproteobacteria bacterium]|jgi:uncharacterized protein with ATP-grasp and redox domains
MKTHLNCIPCFFKQAISMACQLGANYAKQRQVVNNLAKMLPTISLDSSPPEIVKIIYDLVNRTLNNKYDGYEKIKDESNKLTLNIYEKLQEKIFLSNDRLLTATELAIAGNIIDYGGARIFTNINDEMDKIMNQSINNKLIFNYDDFKSILSTAKEVIYLADNAGEVVFDRLLIEEIKYFNRNVEITYVVKEQPIINDATKKDAIQCNIHKICKVMSSGSDVPGTPLNLCSKEFLDKFNKTDMVISKGQGNFETLFDSGYSIFFLLKIKCPFVAKEIDGNIGDSILFYN